MSLTFYTVTHAKWKVANICLSFTFILCEWRQIKHLTCGEAIFESWLCEGFPTLTSKMDYKPTNSFPSLSRPVLPMFSTSISLHSLMSEDAQIMQQTFFVQLYFVRNTREELLSFLLAKEISPCSIEKSVGNNLQLFHPGYSQVGYRWDEYHVIIISYYLYNVNYM